MDIGEGSGGAGGGSSNVRQIKNMNYQKAYEKALQEIKSWCPDWSEYDQKQEAERMADSAYQQYSNFAS
jgi:hypothetical protein